MTKAISACNKARPKRPSSHRGSVGAKQDVSSARTGQDVSSEGGALPSLFKVPPFSGCQGLRKLPEAQTFRKFTANGGPSPIPPRRAMSIEAEFVQIHAQRPQNETIWALNVYLRRSTKSGPDAATRPCRNTTPHGASRALVLAMFKTERLWLTTATVGPSAAIWCPAWAARNLQGLRDRSATPGRGSPLPLCGCDVGFAL